MKRHYDSVGPSTAPNGKRKGLAPFARGLQAMVADRADELARLKERLAELSAANKELESQVASLSRHNREITLVSRMSDLLQTSTSETEAYSIISETMTQLFPENSGALFAPSASRDVLETAVVWGTLPPASLKLPPNGCSTHRGGYSDHAAPHERSCPHCGGDDRGHVCFPLLALGNTIGILHLLAGPYGNGRNDGEDGAAKRSLAKTLAERIGLGIANLKLRESMRNLSIRDPLTGLFNRRYMEEALAQEQHRTRRNDAQLAVIMIDIDHFKQYNDCFGHDGGDAILRALGEFFKEQVRGSDIACRYGGEEFVLILSPSTEEGARQRAETIRKDAALLRVSHANRDLGGITLSLGIAMFLDDESTPAAIVKAADIALYQAKRGGRNRVVMFGEKAARAVHRS